MHALALHLYVYSREKNSKFIPAYSVIPAYSAILAYIVIQAYLAHWYST
jgi:hypothetical protein